MKWTLLLFSMVLALFICAPAVHAQAYDPTDDYNSGYQQGFDHGQADQRGGLDYDYQHSDAYQMGTVDFQSGYQKGYADGFNGLSSNMDTGHHRAMVEVFSMPAFRGGITNLSVGNYNSIDLDDVESIRVNGNVRVILFNRPNFEGRSVTLMGDAPSLTYLQSGPFWSFGLLRHHTGSMIIEPVR